MQQTDTTNLNPQSSNLEPGINPEPPPLSLIDYLLVIVRHKKMILLTTVGAALLTAVITLLMPNIYTATTLILASEDDKAGMSAMMAQLAGMAGGSLAPCVRIVVASLPIFCVNLGASDKGVL